MFNVLNGTQVQLRSWIEFYKVTQKILTNDLSRKNVWKLSDVNNVT